MATENKMICKKSTGNINFSFRKTNSHGCITCDPFFQKGSDRFSYQNNEEYPFQKYNNWNKIPQILID